MEVGVSQDVAGMNRPGLSALSLSLDDGYMLTQLSNTLHFGDQKKKERNEFGELD